MEIDYSEVEEFVRLLTGDKNSVVTWQIFYDPKDEKKPWLAKTFDATFESSKHFLTEANKKKCGVYIGLNETRGQRKSSNVVKFRALFADYDGIEEPSWSVEPSFTTCRDEKHGHAFWLVDDIDSPEDFMSLQMRISTACGTDHSVFDPARVVRVPGFIHYKNKKHPKIYKIKSKSEKRYSVADIVSGFKISAQDEVAIQEWLSSRDGSSKGSGYSDNPIYIEKYKRYLVLSAPPAIVGNGTLTLYKVATRGHDLGVPLELCKSLLWEFYNPKCVPPWDESEHDHFDDVVSRAYKYAKSAAGCATAAGAFMSAEELPPQPEKEPTATELKIDRGDRLSSEEGEVLYPQVTTKSCHYDLARVFDGVAFDGCKVVRFDKSFYVYNGKSWDYVSDDLMKADVQRFYKHFKPSDTFTRGVYAVFRDMVTCHPIENGTLISNPNKDCSSYVPFYNKIVDVDSSEEIEHSPDFFSLNHLPYEYNKTASCDRWLEFLNELWDDDEDLKKQLQEFFGYCLTQDIRYHKFALLIGRSRAGKGVITDVLRELVGHENVSAPTLSSLHKDEMLHSMSMSTVAMIPDAHSVTYNLRDEVLSKFKGITGGDPQTFNVKFKDARTMVFKCRFVMSTNGMPEFVDGSGALANRALVFPFHKTFAGKEDVDLRSKLIAEIEGIAQWALEGLRRLRSNGRFTEAESGLAEKEELREEMSPIARFVKESCVFGENEYVLLDELYNAYSIWCLTKGVKKPLTEMQFAKAVRGSDLDITYKRKYIGGSRPRVYSGIGLTNKMKELINVGKEKVLTFSK